MNPSIEYFAGIFDGEGWFSIHRTRAGRHTREFAHQLYAGLAIRDERVVMALERRFGGSIQFHNLSAKNPKHSDVYRWVAVSANALKFAETVVSFLIVKRKHARVAIKFQRRQRENGTRSLTDNKYERQCALFEKMRSLNVKGTHRGTKRWNLRKSTEAGNAMTKGRYA